MSSVFSRKVVLASDISTMRSMKVRSLASADDQRLQSRTHQVGHLVANFLKRDPVGSNSNEARAWQLLNLLDVLNNPQNSHPQQIGAEQARQFKWVKGQVG